MRWIERVGVWAGTSGADRGRRLRAIGAAVEVGAAQGVVDCNPRVLKDSNNTVVHLAPAPLVAKVGTSVLGRLSGDLERELAVGLHLARAGAPIASPSSDPPPGPCRSDGLVITVWRYCEPDPARETPGPIVGAALRALHGALADYEGDLPAFTVELQEVGSVLADEAAAPALEPADREFLRLIHADLTGAVARRKFDCRPLHGGPHEGNLLSTPAGPLWIDLETACRGPLEWDLASLPEEVAASSAEEVAASYSPCCGRREASASRSSAGCSPGEHRRWRRRPSCTLPGCASEPAPRASGRGCPKASRFASGARR